MRMRSKYRRKDAKLNPAHVDLRPRRAHVPADVVTLKPECNVRSGYCEVDLKGERLPRDSRVAGKSDRISMIA